MGAGERHKMMDTIDMLFTTLTIRAVVITVIMIVRENGGYIVHAHPFREKANAYRIDMIRLMPRDVDAVETYNAHSSDFQNSMAENMPMHISCQSSAEATIIPGRKAFLPALSLTKSSFQAKILLKSLYPSGSSFLIKIIFAV